MPRGLIIILILTSLLSAALAKDTPQDIADLLSEAEKLKYAEKYEEAEKLYDEVLEIAPDNLAALKGKQDCQIMLSPPIPMQHLAPPAYDKKYQELLETREKAETPWDKRRAEFAIECYGMEYTGTVFAKEREELEEKADNMIENAIQRVRKKERAESVYLETAEKLRSLQFEADCSWKGHGPEVLGPALEKLDKAYVDLNYSNPTKPLAFSFEFSPEVTAEGQLSEITLFITNKSSTPVILIDLWLAGLDHRTFSWQKSMTGSLDYDHEKDLFYYNGLAQQETFGIFNLGLLFPRHTTGFQKRIRVPRPTGEAYVRFAVLNEETVANVYIEKENDIYSPAELKELELLARDKVFITGDAPFPGKGTILFDDSQAHIWNQSFTLDSKQK